MVEKQNYYMLKDIVKKSRSRNYYVLMMNVKLKLNQLRIKMHIKKLYLLICLIEKIKIKPKCYLML